MQIDAHLLSTCAAYPRIMVLCEEFSKGNVEYNQNFIVHLISAAYVDKKFSEISYMRYISHRQLYNINFNLNIEIKCYTYKMLFHPVISFQFSAEWSCFIFVHF